MKRIIFLFTLLMTLLLGACKIGPDYKKPDPIIQDSYRWKSKTSEGELKSDWWTLFGDAELNRLEELAAKNNSDIKVAISRMDEARAAVGGAAADYFPAISLQPDISRVRTSGHVATGPYPPTSVTANRFTLPFYLGYEVDIWGRVRRQNEAADARMTMVAAQYYTVLNGIHGDVALNYFLLRAVDTDIEVLKRSVELRKETMSIMDARFRSGVGNELDLKRTQTDLAQTQADLLESERRRGDIEGLIAILCGENPGNFTVSVGNLTGAPPSVPEGLPSDLLERRSDVLEAERELAARNEEIGILKSAAFPSIRLTAQAGMQSNELSDLFKPNSNTWLLDLQMPWNIWAGGKNASLVKGAEARYAASVETYKKRVLGAFRDVEESLRAIQLLSQEDEVTQGAANNSDQLREMSNDRYKQGYVNYLELVDSERVYLQAHRRAANVRAQRFVATVQLIKALGGGWNATQLAAAPDLHN